MSQKRKYYVVWKGKTPGIYSDWKDCEAQVKGEKDAKYKAFETLQHAEAAYRQPYQNHIRPASGGNGRVAGTQNTPTKTVLTTDEHGITVLRPGVTDGPILAAIAVDAACSGNPGVMEYRGVYIPSMSQIFHYRAEKGTNNIGEFLAIVHGLSYLKKHRLDLVLYSDSVNAMKWVRERQCRSKLPLSADTADLWDYVHRAESWLKSNSYTTDIRKWNTDSWGEIPADFGRK
ncbi:MAG: ribonuclease H family protein [Bacteroidales bacterium]|nr:ribonuclease H family protein [Bacteroidales bacterium]